MFAYLGELGELDLGSEIFFATNRLVPSGCSVKLPFASKQDQRLTDWPFILILTFSSHRLVLEGEAKACNMKSWLWKKSYEVTWNSYGDFMCTRSLGGEIFHVSKHHSSITGQRGCHDVRQVVPTEKLRCQSASCHVKIAWRFHCLDFSLHFLR